MKTHPKYNECSQQESDDLLHNYNMMLEDFGPEDEYVQLYKFILQDRGFLIVKEMKTYEMKLICCMCGKHYGTKPGFKPNQKSHGFCGDDCVTTYCNQVGLDPKKFIKEV